ncbi:MAG: hypothetical protein AAFY98_08830 [Verrucomicrobiota bacterium]
MDKDGDKDLLVSTDTKLFGTSGGNWDVYLYTDKYEKIGSIFAHPKAISFEQDIWDLDRASENDSSTGFVRIWVYLKSNGRSGTLGYYVVRKNSVDDIRSISVYVGDPADTEDFGSNIYSSIFSSSPMPYEYTKEPLEK